MLSYEMHEDFAEPILLAPPHAAGRKLPESLKVLAEQTHPNGSTSSNAARRGPVRESSSESSRPSHRTGPIGPQQKKRCLSFSPFFLFSIIQAASGSNLDACFRIGDGELVSGRLAAGLQLRPDSPIHGCMKPDAVEPLAQYQADLAATRDQWSIEET